MTTQTRRRLAKAAVFVGDDDVPFLVAETPNEVAALVRTAHNEGAPLVELTLGDESGWNGRPLFVRTGKVTAVSPPKNVDDTEDDDD